MMENQPTNPKEEYYNVQKEIQNGNVEMAEKWATGGFKELREAANSYVEPEGIPEENFVTPTMSEENTPVEGEAVTPEQEENTFDPLAHEREVFDGEIQKYEDELTKYREMQEAQKAELEKSKAFQEQLLKELEDARKATDTDEFFGVEEVIEREEVETSKVVEEVGESNYKKLEAEFEAFKNQQQQKDYWENITNSYSSFWNTEVGKKYAPEGNDVKQLKEFETFYSDLAENINERDAIRLMHDIRKNGINEYYQEKLDSVGLEVPSDFDKLYDSMEIANFADGMMIDPKMGKLVPSGRGNFGSLEDAYFILNKDKIVLEAKKESYEAMQQKLREKSEAAVQIETAKYAPLSTDMQKMMNPAYRQSLIKKAASSGYDPAKGLGSIKDPAVRQEMQELHANIQKYKKQ